MMVLFQKATNLFETLGPRPLPKSQFPQKILCSRPLSPESDHQSQPSQTPIIIYQSLDQREGNLMLI